MVKKNAGKSANSFSLKILYDNDSFFADIIIKNKQKEFKLVAECSQKEKKKEKNAKCIYFNSGSSSTSRFNFSFNSLYLFLIVTSVTPATFATCF